MAIPGRKDGPGKGGQVDFRFRGTLQTMEPSITPHEGQDADPRFREQPHFALARPVGHDACRQGVDLVEVVLADHRLDHVGGGVDAGRVMRMRRVPVP